MIQGVHLLPYFQAMRPKVASPIRAAPPMVNISSMRILCPYFNSGSFAQTNRLRGNLDQFVIVDIGDAFFKRHGHRRRQNNRVIRAGGPHIGQFLAFGRIHYEIGGATVLADDLARVHRCPGMDKQFAPFLQIK